LKQYGVERADLIGRTPAEFFAHDLDQARRFRRALFDAGHLHLETEERTEDGKPLWVEGDYVCMRDDQNRITGMFGIQRDITERKRAERELQASEERFRLLAGNIREVFWITDPLNRKDLYISPAYEEVWGRRLEEQLRDRNVFIESVLPEDRRMVQETIEKQVQGRKTEMEYRIRRPDGSIRWIWDRAFPIFDESQNVKLITGIAADITERKQAEAETLRHLDELQALYENGLAVGRLLSPREIGERVIQTFTEYLSWHHVTIRLRKGESDDLELVAFSIPHLKEEDKAIVEGNFNARINKVGQGMSGWVVQTGTAIRTGNVHDYPQYVDTYEEIKSGMYMPLKVGDQIIGSISVESEVADAFTQQDERLLATLATQAAVAFENARLYQAVQQELGERRRAEELLEQERNSLAQRVEDRTGELIAANSNLARALRVKDEFLANMSHELRTPLNAILGLSESLGEQVAGALNEKQQKYVQTITESGHHLLSLINDILDLAKIEAGQVTLDISKVDVYTLCQSSLRMVKQIAQKKNQEVSLEIDKNFGLIWADERRLKQMIVNLLSNAVKFTPEGGKLGLEVHGDKDENRVLITVWDSGIGIAESDITRLFQPFVQLSTGLARESTGTGLGLALVAQMARLHSGGVSVSSKPGEGSRFTLVLPWEPALALDTMERMKITGKFRAIKATGDQSRPLILLVEDTAEVGMMVSDYLEAAGYKVIIAKDGAEGLSEAKRVHPDLILMDLQMPRMDGFEATRELRTDPAFKNTPIVALTALAMQGDRERCLAAGMDEYITKPVNLKALVKIIDRCLQPAA
jgi:PAS domain S-box-containing protein